MQSQSRTQSDKKKIVMPFVCLFVPVTSMRQNWCPFSWCLYQTVHVCNSPSGSGGRVRRIRIKLILGFCVHATESNYRWLIVLENNDLNLKKRLKNIFIPFGHCHLVPELWRGVCSALACHCVSWCRCEPRVTSAFLFFSEKLFVPFLGFNLRRPYPNSADLCSLWSAAEQKQGI